MKTEEFDAMLDEIQTYGRTHLGCKFGNDFPEIARILMASDRFKSFVVAAGLIGSIGTMGIRDLRNKFPEGSEAFTNAAIEHLSEPLREFLAEMFYVGYRIGLAAKEVDELRRMGGEHA